MIGIYQQLLGAPNLEKAVAALTDAELREVRGELGRGEHENWPAELVHGVCMLESGERFMNNNEEGLGEKAERLGLAVHIETPLKKACGCDRCHGSEVPQ